MSLLEPGFLLYDETGLPIDLHLALDSSAVDGGDPFDVDADGTTADLGIYGGTNGSIWDLDLDGFPNYFWPGTLSDLPPGYSASDYDTDDWDSSVH